MNAVAHLTCREVVELVTDYLDGKLAPDERSEVEMHLCLCDPCVRYLGQIRALVQAASQVREEELPDEVRDGLLAAFRGFKGRAP